MLLLLETGQTRRPRRCRRHPSRCSKSEGKRSPLTPTGKSNVSAMVHRTARYDYSYYYYYSKTITASIARTKTRLIFSRSGNIFHFHPRDSNAEARQLTSRAVHDGNQAEPNAMVGPKPYKAIVIGQKQDSKYSSRDILANKRPNPCDGIFF